MKITDKNFIDWENQIFGYGYGTGEEYTIPALKQFFRLLKDNRQYDYEILEKHYGELAAWLLINILCHADILDYGTSARFGWLSEKGEMLRDYIAMKTEKELYDLTSVKGGEYVGCYPMCCNCGSNCGKKVNCNPLF
jgi:hypothetical protein